MKWKVGKTHISISRGRFRVYHDRKGTRKELDLAISDKFFAAKCLMITHYWKSPGGLVDTQITIRPFWIREVKWCNIVVYPVLFPCPLLPFQTDISFENPHVVSQ